jgi:hypothetical protein
MERLIKYYQSNIDKLWLNALIPALLALTIFIARYFKSDLFFFLGIVATFLLPMHAYAIGRASKNQIKECEIWKKELSYYQTELSMHKWLLIAVSEMIQRKLQRFRNSAYSFDEGEFRQAVMKNLEMLRKFYSHFNNDPGIFFRTVFFQPSDDGKYLISKFYSTPNGDPPLSHDNIERQKVIFDRRTGQALACATWRDLSPKVAENTTEIHYNYPLQKDKIKSIIALPVFSGNPSDENFIGVITVSTNAEEFFKKSELERHKEYISEFALRIDFEFCRWRAIQSSKKTT